MEHACLLATVAANGEPALVGTTWTLLCPLIYHLFIFFVLIFLCDMSNTPTVHFFISWNVFVELLYAHISQISNTTSRIPYSARAHRYLLPLRRYLEILLPNFCFGFSPYRPNLSYRFVYICTFFLTFPPFPFLWPGLELQAKGDRRIWEIRGRQGGESPETRVDLHVMSLACRAIHPRRGGVRTGSERKPRRARRALRLVCFIGE